MSLPPPELTSFIGPLTAQPDCLLPATPLSPSKALRSLTTLPGVAEAGWYPDPLRPTRARYYDGNDWTDYTVELEADGRLREVDNDAIASQLHDASTGLPRRFWSGREPLLLAVAAVVVLLVVGAVLFVVATTTGDASPDWQRFSTARDGVPYFAESVPYFGESEFEDFADRTCDRGDSALGQFIDRERNSTAAYMLLAFACGDAVADRALASSSEDLDSLLTIRREYRRDWSTLQRMRARVREIEAYSASEECRTEKGAVQTAIAAARTANEVNPPDQQETPDDYLESSPRQWFSWEPALDGRQFTLVQLQEPPPDC